MSDKCVKCDKPITSTSISAKCVNCARVFHPACTREQNFTKNKAWKCDVCVGAAASSPSQKPEDQKPIIEAIQKMKEEINKNTNDKIETVLTSVSALSEEIKSLKITVAGLQDSDKDLHERCNRLEEEKKELREELRVLQLNLRDSEQHQRAANIEIVGFPFTEGENVYTCLQHLASALGLAFKREEISIAHRLRLFSGRHAHPPIICQFVSRSVKATWMSAARLKKNINSTDVNRSLPPSQLYVNEHLTRDNKALLGRARRLQRERKIHFAGYFNGKVLIKPADGDNSTRVTDVAQLDQYDKQ